MLRWAFWLIKDTTLQPLPVGIINIWEKKIPIHSNIAVMKITIQIPNS